MTITEKRFAFEPKPHGGVLSQSQTGPRRSVPEQGSPGDRSPVTLAPYEPLLTQQPPPALLDEQANRQFHVERVLGRRRRQGQYQYLVKWRGYVKSENSLEFEVPLRQDCSYAVDVYEQLARGQRPTQEASHK